MMEKLDGSAQTLKSLCQATIVTPAIALLLALRSNDSGWNYGGTSWPWSGCRGRPGKGLGRPRSAKRHHPPRPRRLEGGARVRRARSVSWLPPRSNLIKLLPECRPFLWKRAS